MTAPVVLFLLALIFVGALVGFLLGAHRESKRKQEALAQAEETHSTVLSGVKSEHDEQIRVLNKAASNDVDKLKQEHQSQTQQAGEAHQRLV